MTGRLYELRFINGLKVVSFLSRLLDAIVPI